MATTNNYSGLTQAVEIRKDELITKASLGAMSLKSFDVYTNLKGKQLIPSLDTSVVFGQGNCLWEPAGGEDFGEVALEPKEIKVQKEWCFRTLTQRFEAWNVKVAQGLESIPYEDKFIDAQMGAINEALDELIWQGDSGLTIDGVIDILDAHSAETIASTATSANTIVEIVDDVVAKIPAKAFKTGEGGKVRVYMSISDFGSYVRAMNAVCCGKIGLIDAASDELAYPGDSRVILTPVVGLEGAGAIVAAPAGSLAYGTDVEGSENIFTLTQDAKTNAWIFNVLFTAGVAVKLPSLTVVYEA